MSVEFLDEVEPAQTTGVEFLGESEPATAEDIEGRMADLRYDPTPAEFSIWKKAKDQESWFQPRRWANTAVEAAGSLAGTAVEAAKEVPQAIMHPGDLVQTILEAGGRGVLRDADMVAKIGANLKDLVTPGHPNQLVLEDYLKMKQQDLEREQYPDGFIRGKTDIPLPAVPADTQARWTREYYDQYIPKVAYENFLNNRESLRRAAAVAAGQENFFPPITGEVRNQLAEAMSLVASPASVAGFGMGASARAGEASLVARSAAAAANVAGKTASKVGRGFEYLGELPGRVAADVAEAVTGSAEAAERARRIVEGGSLAATVVSPALTVPGLSQVAIASQGALRGGQALNAAGEVLQAGARAVTDPVLRKQGLLWNMARDAEAPLWLRNAANAARGLDPALGVAGHLAEGAVAGAAFGGALGLAADGPEGAAGGIGSGAVLGAGFSAVGRLAGSKGIRMAAEDRDLAQWLSTKGEAELTNIRAQNLTREQALATMETEVLARGMLEGGDVHFEYLNGEQFKARTGDTSRGAQYVHGDRPVILINTDYQGPRTLFHELGHALSSLTGLDPQRDQLARVLFTQSTPDKVEISRGIYSPEDLAAFEKQYVDRLSPTQREGWDTLKPEERQARIQGEVIAESFANMLSGSSTGPLGKGVNSLRRRVADAMLLSEQTSMLGRMRRALEAVGVEFSASGEPSELFVKDGKAVTNHPRVDAAVRDYLRAKNNVVRRLLANDAEAVNATITPFDFQKAGNEGLVAAYSDWDGFARNPDGSVRMQNGTPVLMTEREIAQLQANRVEQMINALRTVPDTGEVGLMREQENGAWRGRRLSEAQLKAIEALPNNILSPGMKAKIRALNELAQQPGNQILIDYNAALKGRRYSSGISATTRMLVPLTFNISKAGNFFMETLDTSHFRRKLGVWEKKKNAFDLWGGDTAAFMRDVFRYLENHQHDRPGSVNLDPDPVRAVEKKTAIHEFFNFQGSNARETMLRSRRLDRINRIAPGSGDAFPIDYYKIKANFLPGGSRPTTRRGGRDVEEHIRAQTLANFADRFPGVPAPAAVRIGERLMRELDRTLPRRGNENSLARAERIARLVTRTDASAKQAIAEAMVRGGMKAAEETVRTVALRETVRDSQAAPRRAEITLSPADQRHMDWVSQTAAKASGNRGIDVYWDPTERIGGAIVEAKYVDGRLQLNAATLRSHQQILGAVREELGHQALATPRGQKLLEEFMAGHGLSQAQRQALAEAGYQPREGESLRGYNQRLHDEFVAKAGRIGWLGNLADRLVATVKRALGLSLTQEQAARAILRELRQLDSARGKAQSAAAGSTADGSSFSPRGHPELISAVDPATVSRLNAQGIPAETDGSLNAANATARYSLRAANEWVAKFVKSKEARETYSEKDLADYARAVEQTHKLFGDFSKAPEEIRESPIRDNSDPLFKKTFDLSTICPQQDQYIAILNTLERENGTIYDPHQRFLIGQMIADAGGKPACWYCYGQAGRDMFDAQLARAVGVFNRLAAGSDLSEATIAREFKTWSTEGDLRDTVNKYAGPAREAGLTMDPVRIRDIARGHAQAANPIEAGVAEGIKSWAQAATKANKPKPFNPYTNQILRMEQAKIDAFNKVAGFRMNSQTDFRPWHVLDVTQFLSHLRMRGGMAHVYTRVPEFVEMAGRTGIKFNMSIEFSHTPEGKLMRDANGGVWWNDMNGMPKAKALDFRKRFKDAGTMLVAMTREDLLEGLRNPDVDMIIPYHRGGVVKATEQHLGVQDFSRGQHEDWKGIPKKEKRTVTLKNGKQVTVTSGLPITREHHGNSKGQYLELCKKLGITPKFPEFVNEPGYMKLVRDVARNPSDQAVVDPRKFDWQAANQFIQGWLDKGGTPVDTRPNPALLEEVRGRIARGEWPKRPETMAPTPSMNLMPAGEKGRRDLSKQVEVGDLKKEREQNYGGEVYGSYAPWSGKVTLDRKAAAKLSREERAGLVRHELAHKVETESQLWQKTDTFLWRIWELDKRNPLWDFVSEFTGRIGMNNDISPEIIAELYANHYPKKTFTVQERDRPYWFEEGEQFPKEYPIPDELLEVLDEIEAELGIWTKKQQRSARDMSDKTPAPEGPVRLHGPATAPWPEALISKDPTGSGWRYTWFSKFGYGDEAETTPRGHRKFKSRQAALKAALADGFEVKTHGGGK